MPRGFGAMRASPRHHGGSCRGRFPRLRDYAGTGTAMTPASLLDSLAAARWHVAAKTYGNCHATLVGIVVDWWVSQQSNHCALESGPSYRPIGHGMKGTGVCDALLCEADRRLGVVEVEGGSRKKRGWAVEKVGHFLTQPGELEKLRFALLVFYRYGPRGRADKKSFPDAVDDTDIKTIEAASVRYPQKIILVVGIEKRYEPPVFAHGPYYSGRLFRVSGRAYLGGLLEKELTLWGRAVPSEAAPDKGLRDGTGR